MIGGTCRLVFSWLVSFGVQLSFSALGPCAGIFHSGSTFPLFGFCAFLDQQHLTRADHKLEVDPARAVSLKKYWSCENALRATRPAELTQNSSNAQ
jgi:hypothetical protein